MIDCLCLWWLLNKFLIMPKFSSFVTLAVAVNRRLDEWVRLEQLDLDSVEAVVDEKVEDKV